MFWAERSRPFPTQLSEEVANFMVVSETDIERIHLIIHIQKMFDLCSDRFAG
ncbi:MAG: hypothetical protein NUK65_09680 [Firmicutes bacterium]|nr:hypothetical protein [Bacillota bacterium]